VYWMRMVIVPGTEIIDRIPWPDELSRPSQMPGFTLTALPQEELVVPSKQDVAINPSRISSEAGRFPLWDRPPKW